MARKPKRRSAPSRRSPQPSTPNGSAPADFSAMLERAFARNGDNPILLNIQEGLDALGRDVRVLAVEQGRTSEQVKNIADDQREATESRREIHRKLDGVKDTCTVLKTTVDRIAPLVDGHEKERTEKAGQRKLITKGRVLLASLGTGAGAIWHQWENVRAIWGGHPPPHP